MLRIAILTALLTIAGHIDTGQCAGAELPEPWPESKLEFGLWEGPFAPGEARTRLLHDRGEYILGEQIPMRFGVANAGDRPFIIDVTSGGAAAGFGISTDSTVSISGEDADGKPIAHVDVSMVAYDGAVTIYQVQPGQAYWTTVPIAQQLRIEKPGKYTIRAWMSLDWRDANRKCPPEATTQITVRAPTPEEAQRIVTALRGHPPVDYSVLRLPIYLPLLTDAALRGDRAALAGIASIETAEATAILFKAMEQQLKRGESLSAFSFLEPRLPRATPPAHRGPEEAPEDRLMRRTWSPEYAPRAQALARGLSGSADTLAPWARARLSEAATVSATQRK